MNTGDWIEWHKALVNQNGSLYLNIPKTWATIFGLDKGDRVTLRLLSDGSLKIIGKQEGGDGNGEE